ncbi:glutathione S-transferase 3-like [Garra rufa]|uniref:glutathione S-transferase 3-like n=1 Tax=Garra rufa TaxID=137080 RepID=UPI003CCEE7BB
MAQKVVLHYFNGRGKMEPVRWLLAAAGVEFEEVFLTKREQYEKLLNDGALMFQQVPLVEIDGMKLVQTKAILNYIAGKYNLYGKDLKERALIDMYSEGAIDVMDMILVLPFTPPENKQTLLGNVEEKAKDRFLPVYEKGLKNSQFLVGNQLSRADIHLLEVILMLQELYPTILATFPKLQAFQEKMKALPTISKFLQPGSARKSPPDEAYVKTVKGVLSHLFK